MKIYINRYINICTYLLPLTPSQGEFNFFLFLSLFCCKTAFFLLFFFLCCEISRVFGTAGFMEEAKAPRAEDGGSNDLHTGTWRILFNPCGAAAMQISGAMFRKIVNNHPP